MCESPAISQTGPLKLTLALRKGLGQLEELIAGSRSHRVICLVAGIWLFNAFDLILTLLAHKQGMLLEVNPVAYQVLLWGAVPIVIYKTTLVLGGSVGLLWFRSRRAAELAAIVVLAAYVLVAVRWHLCYELHMLSATANVEWSELAALGVTKS